MGKERDLEQWANGEFKRRGWIGYKMDQGGGVWDHLYISPKLHMIWIEFKEPGDNELDELQVAWYNEMLGRITRGHNRSVTLCGPVNSREQVRAILERYKDK